MKKAAQFPRQRRRDLSAPRPRVGSSNRDTLRYLEASLKALWKRYRKDLERCQDKFSEKAVHDSRVATRRLLSLVELLRPFLAQGRLNKVRRALKRHLDTFSDLRDTQVQLLSLAKLR